MIRPTFLWTILATSALALAMTAKEAWLPKSGGPPACFAGEPPRGSTCNNSGCHTDFAVNSGSATLMADLGGAENGYNLGQTYTIRIALHQAGLIRGGFQAIALQDNNDTISPGIFTLTDPIRTQRIDQDFPHADTGCTIFSKVWIEHTDAGIDDPVMDTIRWEFDWQAPQQDAGSITFYVAAVEADADLDVTGDHVYSLSLTIPSLSTSLTPGTGEQRMQPYPQPAHDRLHLPPTESLASRSDAIRLYDLTGRLLHTYPLLTEIPVAHLPAGTYLLQVQRGEQIVTHRFVKE